MPPIPILTYKNCLLNKKESPPAPLTWTNLVHQMECFLNYLMYLFRREPLKIVCEGMEKLEGDLESFLFLAA